MSKQLPAQANCKIARSGGDFYLPGVRHLIGFGAEIVKLPVAVFALFAFTGAFIGSATFVSAGYFLGREWTLVFGKIRPTLATSSVAVVSFFLIYILAHQWLRKQKPKV